MRPPRRSAAEERPVGWITDDFSPDVAPEVGRLSAVEWPEATSKTKCGCSIRLGYMLRHERMLYFCRRSPIWTEPWHFGGNEEWGLPGSNRGPAVYETAALTR